MNTITIYTDGSCETQTRIGGWAVVLTCGGLRKVLSGSAAETTVNAMELTAAMNGLSALKSGNQTVILFTDSKYVARGINEWLPNWIGRGWKTAAKKPVANQELWQQVAALLERHHVTVTWLPRKQNVEADELAQSARLAHGSEAAQKPADDAGSQTAPTEPPQTVSELRLLIAGSRYATREALEYARRVVRRAHQLGYTIVVGDHPKGVDRAVVQECRRMQAKVLVVGVTNRPRNGGCLHGSYVKVERDTYRAAAGQRFNRYHERDRWMVDNAHREMFIWNGASRGTKAGYDYAVQRGKEAHLITFEHKGMRHG